MKIIEDKYEEFVSSFVWTIQLIPESFLIIYETFFSLEYKPQVAHCCY